MSADNFTPPGSPGSYGISPNKMRELKTQGYCPRSPRKRESLLLVTLLLEPREAYSVRLDSIPKHEGPVEMYVQGPDFAKWFRQMHTSWVSAHTKREQAGQDINNIYQCQYVSFFKDFEVILTLEEDRILERANSSLTDSERTAESTLLRQRDLSNMVEAMGKDTALYMHGRMDDFWSAGSVELDAA